MGHNVVIAAGLLPERNASIIRHHCDGQRQRHTLLFHIGNRLRRIKMGHKDHIHGMLFQIAVQIFGHQAVHIVNRRFFCGFAHEHTQLVGTAKGFRRLLYHIDIEITYQSGSPFSRQGQIIQKNDFMASLLQHFP